MPAEEPQDPTLDADRTPGVALDEAATDRVTDHRRAVSVERGSPADGPGVPTSAGPASVAILRSWTRDQGSDVNTVSAALTSTSPEVDAFLEGDEAREFTRALLSGDIYSLGAATEEGRALPAARWVALAKAAPEAFVWHVPPSYVLPMSDESMSDAFVSELMPWVERAELRVTLNWLGAPGFGEDDDAVDRISDLLRAQAAIVGWAQSVDALEAIIRRGGRWRAARMLQRLLRDFRPDTEEAGTIQRVARKCVDAQLLVRMSALAPWSIDESLLVDLAGRASTDSLVRGFTEGDALRAARIQGEAAARIERIAWRELAGRGTPETLRATAERLLGDARADRNPLLGRAMVEALTETHGEEAIPALTAVFLGGIHRTPVGGRVQRFLLAHAEAALCASLDHLPEWVPSFDASAMERLAWKGIERLDGDARTRVRELAELHDGAAAARLLRELDEG